MQLSELGHRSSPRPWIFERLTCPRDGLPLRESGRERLACEAGHEYPVLDGIPVLLTDELPGTHPYRDRTLALVAEEPGLEAETPSAAVDPYVQDEILKTNGHLYRHLKGHLPRYPIPELRLPPGEGRTLLDVGSNWGRWSFAAARAGYRCVGVDPWLEGARAGRRVAKQLALEVSFVVGDARQLPFRDRSFDVSFSYSVLQHFDKADARRAWSEMARVAADNGRVLVQMPNIFGVRQAYNRLRQSEKDRANPFRVRYWTPPELLRTGEACVGPSRLFVDGYFSLNPQASDLDLMPTRFAWLIRTSELLRRAAAVVPALGYAADSLYIESSKTKASAPGA